MSRANHTVTAAQANERAAEFERRVGGLVPLSVRYGTDAERVEWLLAERQPSASASVSNGGESVDEMFARVRQECYDRAAELRKDGTAKANIEAMGWEGAGRLIAPFDRAPVREDAGDTARWLLCGECGVPTPYDAWSFWQRNPDEETEDEQPWVRHTPGDSDPMYLCPLCRCEHQDDDLGPGLDEGTLDEMVARRHELASGLEEPLQHAAERIARFAEAPTYAAPSRVDDGEARTALADLVERCRRVRDDEGVNLRASTAWAHAVAALAPDPDAAYSEGESSRVDDEREAGERVRQWRWNPASGEPTGWRDWDDQAPSPGSMLAEGMESRWVTLDPAVSSDDSTEGGR